MKKTPQAIFENLFRQDDNGIIVCNSDGIIVGWNEALSAFTGKIETDVLNTPIWNYPELFTFTSTINDPREHLKHLLSTDTFVKSIGLHRFKLKMGENYNLLLEISARETIIEDNKYFIITFRDFTRLYRKELELIDSDENLREFAEMVPEIVT